ncbi:LAME_0D05358g1_1 [Lachancea meyersii CBS 8951]|uniref:LAME_0D05358g1_1 n=1 Tax=Lachancea meyersii CBS 8951 TaxID=1266667 RepID=A0A1G4J8L2_9SACH|nr:LAME_0D05358g1_1 [Lachancea meyersii CBS 8951]
MERRLHTASRALRHAVSNAKSTNHIKRTNHVKPAAPTAPVTKHIYQRAGHVEPGLEIKSLSEIQSSLDERYYSNYLLSSKDWCKHNEINWTSMKDCLNMDLRSLSAKHQQNLQWYIDGKFFDKEKNTFSVAPNRLLDEPLSVGDVVLLRSDPSQLCMCVEVPTDVMNPSYAFATVDGHIKFGMRSMILLRMPSFHNKPVNYLIRQESPYLDNRVGTVKDDPDKTYILPILARLLYTSYVPFEITKAAWSRMATVTKKLELLHRFLQRGSGPWQISIFKLCELVELINLEKCRSSPTNVYVEELFSKVGITSSDLLARQKTSVEDKFDHIDAATFLATYWALVQQQEHNLWGEIHIHRAMLTPISVTILPLKSSHLYYDSVLKKLKRDNYAAVSKFAHHVNSDDLKAARHDFPEINRLLRDYAAGNFHKNGPIVTMVSKLFRKIEEYKSRDITRDLCHALLRKLEPDLNINPLHFNDNLAVPLVSGHTALDGKVCELVSPIQNRNFSKRHDFGNMAVYCIDSEDAHEIDDGISIDVKSPTRFGLHIHIADPVPLFANSVEECPENEVWRIAFARSFTSYLPDRVTPMLPKAFSKAGDLGHDGVPSTTLTFSVDVECRGDGLQVLEDTFQVRKGLVSKFPKVTYKSVDELLNKKRTASQEVRELSAILKVATLLRKRRVEEEDAIVFGEGFNKGLVKLSDNGTNEAPAIEFVDQVETASTVMVSEMMILANTLAGKYFRDKKLPGVFRCYRELNLKDRAQSGYDSLRSMMHSKKLPSVRDITKLSSLLNSSFYTGKPSRHQMIGAPAYLTVTSPLRRFPDLINHLQLHAHLDNTELPFTQSQVDQMIWHIQSRDVVLRKAAQHSASYWTLKYLKSKQEQNPGFSLSVMVTSVPQMGYVRCGVPELSAARGILKLRPDVASHWAIGDTVSNCKIINLDCLDGVMELEMQ